MYNLLTHFCVARGRSSNCEESTVLRMVGNIPWNMPRSSAPVVQVAETEEKRIIEQGHWARVLQLEGLVLIVEPIESGSG